MVHIGQMEYWNVDLTKEVAHLFMRIRRINLLVKENFFNQSIFGKVVYTLLHHSSIPIVSEAN